MVPRIVPYELEKLRSGLKFMLFEGGEPAMRLGYIRFGITPQRIGIEGHGQITDRFLGEYHAAQRPLPLEERIKKYACARGGGYVDVRSSMLRFYGKSVDLGPYDRDFLNKTLGDVLGRSYLVEDPNKPR